MGRQGEEQEVEQRGRQSGRQTRESRSGTPPLLLRTVAPSRGSEEDLLDAITDHCGQKQRALWVI